MIRFIRAAIPFVVAATFCWSVAEQASAQTRPSVDDTEDSVKERLDRFIHEAGEVRSGEGVAIYNEVPGQTPILSIVPSGSRVRQGDLLVELDASSLESQLQQQRILVSESRARQQQAESQLEAARRFEAAALPAAELKMRATELARSAYLGEGGEFEVELDSAKQAVTLARQRLDLIQSRLEAVAASDQASRAEWELNAAQAQHQVNQATARIKLLEEHVRKRETARFDYELAAARMELTQTRSKAQQGIAEAQAAVEISRIQADQAEEQLESLEQQLAATRIEAPQDGVAVHPVARGRRPEPLEAGSTVRERQLLLTLPDLTKLHVEAHVNQTHIDGVRVGQPATVVVDAFPGRRIAGKVVDVARTPLPSSWIASDVVEYAVTIELAGPAEGVKPGMTAEVQIQVK